MAVPKFRISRSKRNSRRAHDFLETPGVSLCKTSGEIKQPHCIGPTGYYKGRLVDRKLARKHQAATGVTQDFEA
jgi:large subunit ribosomal protein L32